MRSQEIYDEILSLTDDELLLSLPTEDKQCCSKCKSLTLRKRIKDNTYYCSICKEEAKIETIKYYFKNKTSNPIEAVARHRKFWNKIFEIELGKELVKKIII